LSISHWRKHPDLPARTLKDDYIRAMCGRPIQSSGALRYAIVDGTNVRDFNMVELIAD
jgi:hypothetical protein